jgi:hypothetical protein
MGPFLASMLYSYALIAYDLFLGGVVWGIVLMIYSAMLWIELAYDAAKAKIVRA